MTVTKEILQDLKIISMNLINESDVLFPCIITKYDKGKIVFSLHNNIAASNRISLQVVVQEDEGSFISEVQALNIIEKDSNYIIATIKTEEQKHNKTIMNLLVKYIVNMMIFTLLQDLCIINLMLCVILINYNNLLL